MNWIKGKTYRIKVYPRHQDGSDYQVFEMTVTNINSDEIEFDYTIIEDKSTQDVLWERSNATISIETINQAFADGKWIDTCKFNLPEDLFDV